MSASNRSPRHCMIVHAHYPIGETRVERQALALIEAGVGVDVVCLRGQGEPNHETIDGVDVWRLPVERHRGSGMVVQLVEYLAFFFAAFGFFTFRHLRRRYKSVQIHNLPDFLVFSGSAAKFTGTPIILDLHDLMPEFMASRIGADLAHPLVRFLAWQERISCRFADVVVTVTDEWADTLRARSVQDGRVAVVMNIADARLFHRQSEARIREDGRFELIYHGTLTHRYGIDTLIDAVAIVREDIPDIHLLLHGQGEARDDLMAKVERMGLRGTIDFSEGMVEVEELPAMIRGADVGVVPYRADIFTDGILPTKLLEYVAMGIPVVASDTSGMRRYFGPDAVEYFRSGDAESLAKGIRTLHDDAARRAQMIESSDSFNHDYSWKSEAAAYVDLVTDLW